MTPLEDIKTDRTQDAGAGVGIRGAFRFVLERFGILPFVLVAILLFFGLQEPRFLSGGNILNVLRQSTYLVIVSIGQMIVLLTGGFDLSMGSVLALVSVMTALVMAGVLGEDPTNITMAITLGIAAGVGTGAVVGLMNGIGVAILKVSPFMMTLGMASIAFGGALIFSGASPIYGLPKEFGQIFGHGGILGIPSVVYLMAAVVALTYVVLNWTVLGRRLYAIGSSVRAAQLSGIHIRANIIIAYVLASTLAAISGVLLTARIGSGEATLGSQGMVLQSVAACAIGGVSLYGGVGRVGNVVLGAMFIALIANGMNLIRIESYGQQVALGVVLIAAIVIEHFRQRWLGIVKQ